MVICMKSRFKLLKVVGNDRKDLFLESIDLDIWASGSAKTCSHNCEERISTANLQISCPIHIVTVAFFSSTTLKS